jgi:hypothetical protein
MEEKIKILKEHVGKEIGLMFHNGPGLVSRYFWATNIRGVVKKVIEDGQGSRIHFEVSFINLCDGTMIGGPAGHLPTYTIAVYIGHMDEMVMNDDATLYEIKMHQE